MFNDLDHKGAHSTKTKNPIRRWLMTFAIKFQGFIVTHGTKVSANTTTFFCLTASNADTQWCQYTDAGAFTF